MILLNKEQRQLFEYWPKELVNESDFDPKNFKTYLKNKKA